MMSLPTCQRLRRCGHSLRHGTGVGRTDGFSIRTSRLHALIADARDKMLWTKFDDFLDVWGVRCCTGFLDFDGADTGISLMDLNEHFRRIPPIGTFSSDENKTKFLRPRPKQQDQDR